VSEWKKRYGHLFLKGCMCTVGEIWNQIHSSEEYSGWSKQHIFRSKEYDSCNYFCLLFEHLNLWGGWIKWKENLNCILIARIWTCSLLVKSQQHYSTSELPLIRCTINFLGIKFIKSQLTVHEWGFRIVAMEFIWSFQTAQWSSTTVPMSISHFILKINVNCWMIESCS